MAVIFLGERLAPYHLVGAALVAGGLGLASLRRAPAVPVAARPQMATNLPQGAARHAPQPQFGPAAERAP